MPRRTSRLANTDALPAALCTLSSFCRGTVDRFPRVSRVFRSDFDSRSSSCIVPLSVCVSGTQCAVVLRLGHIPSVKLQLKAIPSLTLCVLLLFPESSWGSGGETPRVATLCKLSRTAPSRHEKNFVTRRKKETHCPQCCCLDESAHCELICATTKSGLPHNGCIEAGLSASVYVRRPRQQQQQQ